MNPSYFEFGSFHYHLQGFQDKINEINSISLFYCLNTEHISLQKIYNMEFTFFPLSACHPQWIYPFENKFNMKQVCPYLNPSFALSQIQNLKSIFFPNFLFWTGQAEFHVLSVCNDSPH